MSIALQNRVHRGVPTGGQFAAHARPDDTIRLIPDDIPSEQAWLDRNDLSLPPISQAEFEVRLSRLGRPATDLDRADVFRAVHREHFGVDINDLNLAADAAHILTSLGRPDAAEAIARITSAVATRASIDESAAPTLVPPAAADMVARTPRVVRSITPFGDEIDFHIASDDVVPSEPGAARVQCDRPLTREEADRLDELIRYAMNAVHRDSVVDGYTDSDSSTVIQLALADGRTRAKDRERFRMFERKVAELLADGSQVRQTDRSGPGTRGTRAIDPWANPPRVAIYYDRVVPNPDR